MRSAFLFFSLMLSLSISSFALATDWPQVITAQEGEIIVYQPQPEQLENNVLSGRAAFQLALKGRDEPIFGAFWFSAKLDTDRAAGTATVRDITVENVTWPDSKDAQEQRFTAVVESAVPSSGLTLSMEQLAASLETAEVVQQSLENLNNEPPKSTKWMWATMK